MTADEWVRLIVLGLSTLGLGSIVTAWLVYRRGSRRDKAEEPRLRGEADRVAVQVSEDAIELVERVLRSRTEEFERHEVAQSKRVELLEQRLARVEEHARRKDAEIRASRQEVESGRREIDSLRYEVEDLTRIVRVQAGHIKRLETELKRRGVDPGAITDEG